MRDPCTRPVVFPELFDRLVWARFDEAARSSNGGQVTSVSASRISTGPAPRRSSATPSRTFWPQRPSPNSTGSKRGRTIRKVG